MIRSNKYGVVCPLCRSGNVKFDTFGIQNDFDDLLSMDMRISSRILREREYHIEAICMECHTHFELDTTNPIIEKTIQYIMEDMHDNSR